MIASYKALGPHGRDEAEHLLGSNSDFLTAQSHALLGMYLGRIEGTAAKIKRSISLQFP